MLAGAVFGGVGWGLLAVDAVGAAADDMHLNRLSGTNLPGALVVSLVCLAVAGVLPRALRTLAVALVVAPVSGWFVLGLLYLQAVGVVTTWR